LQTKYLAFKTNIKKRKIPRFLLEDAEFFWLIVYEIKYLRETK